MIDSKAMALSANTAPRKRVFREKFDSSPNILRGGISAVCALAALLLLVIAPIFTFGDESVSLSVNVGFIGLLKALAGGGTYEIEHVEFGTLGVTVPAVATTLVLVTAVLWLACLTLGVLGAFGKLGGKDKIILSAANFAAFAWQAVVFVVLIASKSIKAQNIYGEETAFYRTFSLTATFLVCVLLALVAGGCSLGVNGRNVKNVRRYKLMYLFLLPAAVLVVIYNLYPMLLSFCLSLKDYVIADGIWGSAWVGFKNFKTIFVDPDMLRIIGNTILISVLRMVISIIPPIILAVMLFDMGARKVRKGIQTIIYIPHFFSWVVVYAIAYAFVNPDGLINNVVNGNVQILANEGAFIPLLLVTDLWKECGWGTILYMAALTNVDPSLHEAAAIDGAGPVKRLFKITLPSITPTIVFTTVMAVGNLLKGAGYEQIMLFGSDIMKSAQVIDTWVVWRGLQRLQYGLGAAVSFFQSFIGMLMVIGCNALSKRWVGVSLY